MAEKDGLIQQKEKLYVELKAILARQPGPEVAEQLSIYQASYFFFRNVASPRARPPNVARGLRFTFHAGLAELTFYFFYFLRRTR